MTGPGQLEGRRVLVTGAARGIGHAIAAACHTAGAEVVGVDRDKPAEPPAWTTHTCDVTDSAAVAELLARLPGPLDCLVNNAGVSRRAELAELDDATWDAVHAVNLAAPVRLVRDALPHLRTPGASIVNVSSLRGSRAFAGDVAYIAAKGGLDAATRAMAVELGPRGIRVNSVAPGAIATELNRDVLADPAHHERVLSRIPLGRVGEPADVGGPVVFLASEAARFVTGAVLPVDGAQTALG